MSPTTLNILIGGEAGQGLVTVGQLLARGLVRSGYHVVVTQTYQSRIRGGHNTFAVRVSTEEIAAPQEPVDLLIALNRQTVDLHREEVTPQGLIVVDQDMEETGGPLFKVPFKKLAGGRFFNIAALGVAGSLLGLQTERMLRLMDDLLGKKKPQMTEENRRVFSDTFQWCAGRAPSFPKLPAVENPVRRFLMDGNEAIALGALSAGVRFCSFYPMTPSTSISQNLAARARDMGLIVEQGEDEIAVINMALGASFVGAPAMVATSGGGFALMVEGVSLSGMTETPIVIVVGQRPGPATGLPTRTEQADLEFVLHAGHGEFPRAVFSPGSVEECFHLTRKAFDVAERFQGPAFILTDQFLADSLRAISPVDIEQLDQIKVDADPETVAEPYVRYAFTSDGVSPRRLPGRSRHLVVAGSDEHTEDGHITEDPSVRTRMVEKRMAKLDGIREEAVAPRYDGEASPDLLIVCWGSTHGAVEEASSVLRRQGKHVAVLHFSQVWPLVPARFIKHLEAAGRVVCVEGNSIGQMARLIRRETGFPIQEKILRYDGLPITPEFILRELNS